MTRTRTKRLGLITESDDELVDSFPENWPILDTVAGATLIANGASPTYLQVYDGQLFRETTTGIMWIAATDPINMTYKKRYIAYPWHIRSNISGLSVPNSATMTEYPLTSVVAAHCINSSLSAVVAGKVVVPIDGLYQIDLLVRWGTNGTNQRGCAFGYNGVLDTTFNESIEDASTGVTSCWACDVVNLGAGQNINVGMWQNSGGNLTANAYLNVGLVSPY